MVDTLGSCLFNTKLTMEELLKMSDSLSHILQKECIDGIEQHEKHYVQQNKNLLKRATEFQYRLTSDLQMLNTAREEYHNSVANLNKIKEKRAAKEQRKRANSDNMGGSFDNNSSAEKSFESPYVLMETKSKNPFIADALDRATKSSSTCQSAYQMALDSYNETVGLFETNFKPLVNNIQQADKENI